MAKPWIIRELDPRQPLSASMRKILSTRISELYFFERIVAEADDVEALHDMRVAGRRLQALLRVFSSLFPKKAHRQALQDLRLLIKDLGNVREHDVLLERMRPMSRTLAGDQARPLLMLLAREELARTKALLLARRRIQQLRRMGFEQRLSALASRLA